MTCRRSASSGSRLEHVVVLPSLGRLGKTWSSKLLRKLVGWHLKGPWVVRCWASSTMYVPSAWRAKARASYHSSWRRTRLSSSMITTLRTQQGSFCCLPQQCSKRNSSSKFTSKCRRLEIRVRWAAITPPCKVKASHMCLCLSNEPLISPPSPGIKSLDTM